MANVYFENELKRRLDSAMAREKERLQQSRYRRNAAAIVDFTSNLLSLVGRGKGVRYMPVTNTMAQHGGEYAKALQRYNETLNDYKGVIAGNLLRERLAANKRVAARSQPVPPVVISGENTPAVIDGARIDKVFNKSRTNKNKDYVSVKFR